MWRFQLYIWSQWWIFPCTGRYKLNSDECCKDNPGEGGGESILRDDKGQVLFACADYYANTTNSIAEAKALLQGLQVSKEKEFDHIDIEVYSLMLKNIIEGSMATPWSIAYEVRKIKHLLSHMEYIIAHTYRESNQAADFLAN
ncbi:hypothetical protein LguiB_027883 [Lonicera macranthoides]